MKIPANSFYRYLPGGTYQVDWFKILQVNANLNRKSAGFMNMGILSKQLNIEHPLLYMRQSIEDRYKHPYEIIVERYETPAGMEIGTLRQSYSCHNIEAIGEFQGFGGQEYTPVIPKCPYDWDLEGVLRFPFHTRRILADGSARWTSDHYYFRVMPDIGPYKRTALVEEREDGSLLYNCYNYFWGETYGRTQLLQLHIKPTADPDIYEPELREGAFGNLWVVKLWQPDPSPPV